jgi:hypothetical protein
VQQQQLQPIIEQLGEGGTMYDIPMQQVQDSDIIMKPEEKKESDKKVVAKADDEDDDDLSAEDLDSDELEDDIKDNADEIL